MVLQGVPFRDAYNQVGQMIEEGKFKAGIQISHTHEGSIGNLCNDRIRLNFTKVLVEFQFQKIESIISKLTD